MRRDPHATLFVFALLIHCGIVSPPADAQVRTRVPLARCAGAAVPTSNVPSQCQVTDEGCFREDKAPFQQNGGVPDFVPFIEDELGSCDPGEGVEEKTFTFIRAWEDGEQFGGAVSQAAGGEDFEAAKGLLRFVAGVSADNTIADYDSIDVSVATCFYTRFSIGIDIVRNRVCELEHFYFRRWGLSSSFYDDLGGQHGCVYSHSPQPLSGTQSHYTPGAVTSSYIIATVLTDDDVSDINTDRCDECDDDCEGCD